MHLTQNLFLSPDFHKFQCTTRVSGAFAAQVCTLKDFLALLLLGTSIENTLWL